MATKTLTASCKGCKFVIGVFSNSWTQVGKSYYTPCEAPQNIQVQDKGMARRGEPETLVEGCELQDVCCPACRIIFGLRCVSTPPGHVLVKEQLLLHEPSLGFKSGRRGVSSKLVVQEVWSLRNRRPLVGEKDTQISSQAKPQSPPTSRGSPKKKTPAPQSRSAPTQPSKASRTASADNGSAPATPARNKKNKSPFKQAYGDVEAEYSKPNSKPASFFTEPFTVSAADLAQMKTDINRIDTAGYQVISAFDHAVSRMDGDIKKAHDSAAQAGIDLGNVRNDVTILKTDIAEVKTSLSSAVSMPILEEKLDGVVSKFETSVAPVKKDVTDIKALIKKKAVETDVVKKDVAALKADAKDSKAGLQNLLAQMDPLERELGVLKKAHKESLQMIRDQSKEIMALQNEVKELRYEIEADNQARQLADASQAQSQPQQATGIASQDLDILTMNLSNIGAKAAMVETLQMEFQLFRSRFQRLEQLVSGPQQQQQQTPMPPSRVLGDRHQGLATAEQIRVETPSDQLNHAHQFGLAYSGVTQPPQFSVRMPSLPETHAQSPTKPLVQPQPKTLHQPRMNPSTQHRKRPLPVSPKELGDENDDDDDDDCLLRRSPPSKRLHLASASRKHVSGSAGQLHVADADETDDLYRWSPSPPGLRKTSASQQISPPLPKVAMRTRSTRSPKKSYAARKG
ncbi:hypothetical protein BROUX41_005636 [Berkeleyomyces rouxiae]|uniref:uncharacterized protein n=1 Tax=Berkeleyomyces rouxiae TaxID=2035830 RepID=UPI003B803761